VASRSVPGLVSEHTLLQNVLHTGVWATVYSIITRWQCDHRVPTQWLTSRVVVQEGLQDFVDLWATSAATKPIALVALTSMHTLALSPEHVQGWMAAVVRALRSGVPTVMVPADASRETLLQLVLDYLASAKPLYGV
jgi:hypothetical protein